MQANTHLEINTALCGEVLDISERGSRVQLALTQEMAADAFGLVHGGFIFGAADYAAMVAINAPTVVLAGAEVKFLSPSQVGDVIIFEAAVQDPEARKKKVVVTGKAADGTPCFEGTFTCVVPSKHVLDNKR